MHRQQVPNQVTPSIGMVITEIAETLFLILFLKMVMDNRNGSQAFTSQRLLGRSRADGFLRACHKTSQYRIQHNHPSGWNLHLKDKFKAAIYRLNVEIDLSPRIIASGDSFESEVRTQVKTRQTHKTDSLFRFDKKCNKRDERKRGKGKIKEVKDDEDVWEVSEERRCWFFVVPPSTVVSLRHGNCLLKRGVTGEKRQREKDFNILHKD